MDVDPNALLRRMAREANQANNKRRDFRVPRSALPRELAEMGRDVAAVCRRLADRAPDIGALTVARLVVAQYDILVDAALASRTGPGKGLRDRAERARTALAKLEASTAAPVVPAGQTEVPRKHAPVEPAPIKDRPCAGARADSAPARTDAPPTPQRAQARSQPAPVDNGSPASPPPPDTSATDPATRRRSTLIDWREIDRCLREEDD